MGRVAVLLCLVAAAVAPFLLCHAQNASVDEMSTPERLEKPGWWPTKFAARSEFTGPAACQSCHSSIGASAAETAMARALTAAQDCPTLKTHVGAYFKIGQYSYQIEHTPTGPAFTVSDGQHTLTEPINWCFGSGNISQVFLSAEPQGTFNESKFSYFDTIHAFDITPNHHQPQGLDKAEGRTVSDIEVRRCFNCHAVGVPAKGPITDIVAGVSCESCHGPGSAHASAMKSRIEGGEGLIMNPGRLSPVDLGDFCGACHATSVDVQLNGSIGAPTIRFPVYRLENSKCWGNGTDRRIGCTGCHDPHQELARDSAYYDKKCLACHVQQGAKPGGDHPGAACPTATKECITCHMPKYNFPDTHYEFTDHTIRVVRAGAPVPD